MIDDVVFDWFIDGGGSLLETPTVQASSFIATAISSTEIRVAWISITGSIVPTDYLILIKDGSGSFVSVSNGVAVDDDTDLSNNSGAKNVAYQLGSQSYTFIGLTIDTDYQFEIYAYNDDGYIYNIDSVPTASATTMDANPANFANKVFWYRSDDVTQAGDISAVNERFNVNNDLVAVGGRNVPTYVTNQLNGHPSIRFTAADNEILTEPGVTGVTDLTFYILLRALSTSSTRILFTNILSQQGWNVLIDTNRIQATCRGGSSQLLQFDFSDTTAPHLVTQKFDSVGSGTSVFELKLDGAERARSAVLNPMQNSAGICYFGSDLSNLSFDGHVFEILAVSKYQTAAEEIGFYNYVNVRYGLTIKPAIFNSFKINSTLDATVTNLYCRYIYQIGFVGMPIVDLDHSWSGNALDFIDSTMNRFAAYGVLCIAKGDRGRNGAGGSRDASMRELYDHYEIIKQVVAQFSSLVDTSRVINSGYSGGGGNAIAKRVKFPYLYTMTVDHYGMTDYDEWYDESSAGRRTEISTAIGGTPPSDSYAARYSRTGASQCPAKLRIYHDVDDADVDITHSDFLEDELIADGFTNYVYTRTQTGSPIRAIHGLPNTGDPGAPVINFESDWIAEAFTLPVPVIPDSGTLEVRGFVVVATPTDFRFEFWLGSSANPKSSGSTNNEHGTLVWNYLTNTYTFTPLSSGTVHYYFIDDLGRTSTGSTTTEVTFNPA